MTASWFSERVGAWSEEVALYPSGATRAARAHAEGALVIEDCSGPATLRSSEFRPELSLCAAGRTWPIMVTPYMAGWPYWPAAALLPPDVFLLRKLGLVLGAYTLLLAFWIVSRVADPWQAAVGVLATSMASPFVLAHGLLVHFELVPLPLIATAGALLLTGARSADEASAGSPTRGDEARPSDAMSRRRLAAIGFLIGVSVAVNLKALFLVVPLAALAWRRGDLRGFDRWRVGLAAGVSLVPLVPTFAFAMVDQRSGFNAQVSYRAANLLAHLTSPDTLLEPLNLLTYWTDVAAYGDIATGAAKLPHLWTWAFPVLALFMVGRDALRALLGRAHDPLFAVCGVLLFGYMVPAALLYDQQPAANYAPLHAVFGIAAGVTALRAARWLGNKADLQTRGRTILSVAMITICFAGFAWNTLRRGDPARLPTSTNAVAQRAAVAHLELAGTPVVTATYNLAGVPSAISRGRLDVTHIQPYLDSCPGDTDDLRAGCQRERWTQVVRTLGEVRLVVPATRTISDEDAVATIAPTLRSLRSEHFDVRRERRFHGVDTGPLIDVWRLRLAPAPEALGTAPAPSDIAPGSRPAPVDVGDVRL